VRSGAKGGACAGISVEGDQVAEQEVLRAGPILDSVPTAKAAVHALASPERRDELRLRPNYLSEYRTLAREGSWEGRVAGVWSQSQCSLGGLSPKADELFVRAGNRQKRRREQSTQPTCEGTPEGKGTPMPGEWGRDQWQDRSQPARPTFRFEGLEGTSPPVEPLQR